MRHVLRRMALCTLAAALFASLPLPAQQTSANFRWIDFHAQQDQNIVTWVTRSLVVAKWTSIREIGVVYDAALVVTVDLPNPQATPGTGTFTVYSVSLTSHVVTPLLTGVDLRWFDRVRFSDGTTEEWPVLYDNCRECAPNTYFTAFYYDVRNHAWGARWMSGGHGVPVWNADHPGNVNWTQVYAVMSGGEGHVALYTWNHFDYGKQKPAEDYLYRYDIDPFSDLDRTVMLNGKELDATKLELCRGQDAVEGLERGQDSPLCQQMLKVRGSRQPVTTPPANNRGQSMPPGRH
jgi:hypothetical protein